MGEKELLLNIIDKAREALDAAQNTAAGTPRPANACPAHDAQFALSQALCSGLSTLLMIKREEMKDSLDAGEDALSAAPQDGAVGKCLAVIRSLTPWRWPLAIAVFSPFAGDVVSKVIGIFKG